MEHALFSIPQVVEEKELSDFKKKQILQNELFVLLGEEDIRKTNLPRYKLYLQKTKQPHSQESLKNWSRCKDKTCSKIRAINSKSTLGFFTARVKLDEMYALLSKCRDKLNRGESPTMYVYSLNSVDNSA